MQFHWRRAGIPGRVFPADRNRDILFGAERCVRFTKHQNSETANLIDMTPHFHNVLLAVQVVGDVGKQGAPRYGREREYLFLRRVKKVYILQTHPLAVQPLYRRQLLNPSREIQHGPANLVPPRQRERP